MSSPLAAALAPASSPTHAARVAASSPNGRAGALPPLAATVAGAEPKEQKRSKHKGNKIAPLEVAAASTTVTMPTASSSSSGSASKPTASLSSAALASSPPPSSSKSKSNAKKYAVEGETVEQRTEASAAAKAAPAPMPSPSHTIRVHDPAPASSAPSSSPMVTEAELLSEIDRTIDLYPLLEETHLENRMLLEPVLACLCCCRSVRAQRSAIRTMHEWLSYFLPLLSLLWLASMVLSLTFLVDLMPASYLPALVFSGLYPLLRLCFASIPVLRLLLGSFETWFLLIQAGLLVSAFGALAAWDLRFVFVVGCLLPSITQIILLDANYSSSVAFTTLAMAFGALYMSALALLLGTGQIVQDDIVLDCRWFRVGLTDFCIQRLITLILFIVKNIFMLLSEPQAYLGVYGLVSRTPVPREPTTTTTVATTGTEAAAGTVPTSPPTSSPTATSSTRSRRRDKSRTKTQQELRWTKTRRSLV